MAKLQLDFLDEERRFIEAFLVSFEDLALTENRVDPYSPSNLYCVFDKNSTRALRIEISHKLAAEFSQDVIRELIAAFASSDAGDAHLVC
jgi:hypothetical protein